MTGNQKLTDISQRMTALFKLMIDNAEEKMKVSVSLDKNSVPSVSMFRLETSTAYVELLKTCEQILQAKGGGNV